MTKPMADNAVAPLIHRDGAAHLIHRLKCHQGEPEGRALAHILLTTSATSIHSAAGNLGARSYGVLASR